MCCVPATVESHDCAIGAGRFDDLHRPRVVDGQRASALRFGDPRAQALLAGLLAFRVLPDGFQNRDLRQTVSPLLALSVEEYSRGRMTYDLRRLRLRGLIERIPFTRRYRVTDDGLRTALCYHRTYARVLRPAMSVVFEAPPRSASLRWSHFFGQVAKVYSGVERRHWNDQEEAPFHGGFQEAGGAGSAPGARHGASDRGALRGASRTR